jgi:exosortase/archaeosortase family protein
MKKDFVILQAVILFAVTNLLWSGHRDVAEWIHLILGQPAAYVAGFLLGSPPSLIDGNWVITVAGTLVRVTRECDAFGFFSLIASISIVHVLGRSPARTAWQWAMAAGVLAGAFFLTIFLNGIRIMGAYYVHAWAQALDLERYQAVLHLGIGVMIFLPALIAVLIYWERDLFYEKA